MPIVQQAIPLLVVALMVYLIAQPHMARRQWSPPRPRRPKPRRTKLTVVSQGRMDDELNDLLKRAK